MPDARLFVRYEGLLYKVYCSRYEGIIIKSCASGRTMDPRDGLGKLVLAKVLAHEFEKGD